jgi:hypothetical protein
VEKNYFVFFLCLQEGRTIVRPEPELCDGDAESEEKGGGGGKARRGGRGG